MTWTSTSTPGCRTPIELLGPAKNDLRDLGTWYRPTSLEIAVPSYVKDVKSLADLKGKAGTFGGRIIGIEPGTGEMNLLKTKVLPGYGLDGVHGRRRLHARDAGRAEACLREEAAGRRRPACRTGRTASTSSPSSPTTRSSWRGEHDAGPSPARSSPSGIRSSPSGSGTSGCAGESELGTLESEIKQRGQGHEEAAVAAWLKEHPDVVERMTPQ